MTSKHILNACPSAIEFSYSDVVSNELSINDPCIYHICENNEVVYIGSTRNFKDRIRVHGRKYKFTKVVVVPFAFRKDSINDMKILRIIESHAITISRPILNCVLGSFICAKDEQPHTLKHVLSRAYKRKIDADGKESYWAKYFLGGGMPIGIIAKNGYEDIKYRFNYQYVFNEYNSKALVSVRRCLIKKED